MFSRPKILFLVSLLFVALLNSKFNPYLLFKFLIFYHSSIRWFDTVFNTDTVKSMIVLFLPHNNFACQNVNISHHCIPVYHDLVIVTRKSFEVGNVQ